MNKEHTEIPFEITKWASHDHIHISHIDSIGATFVADCGIFSPNTEANAHFIVKACNYF
jgi:hypothetical protein